MITIHIRLLFCAREYVLYVVTPDYILGSFFTNTLVTYIFVCSFICSESIFPIETFVKNVSQNPRFSSIHLKKAKKKGAENHSVSISLSL